MAQAEAGAAERLVFGKPEPLLRAPFSALYPALSPDGRWLAYRSSERGVGEIWVRPVSSASPNAAVPQWRVSGDDGGSWPIWSPQGGELFYESENRIMVVRYQVKGDSFAADRPKVWSNVRFADIGFNCPYAIAPDGRRFAVVVEPEVEPLRHVTVLLNFFDELRRRVPVRR